ncbi:Histone-lysine N-methyltransferase SETMAR [Vespula squamosa]|uniref:Histone-lysine N-methyltransferase SETMAR n=1 Tax=Vespula squamosa TaxID=30214 RepID=A0ABD2BGK0_VESSQ
MLDSDSSDDEYYRITENMQDNNSSIKDLKPARTINEHLTNIIDAKSHILLHYFGKGKKALQAHKKLCAVYANEALKERQCQNWFAKFRSDDVSLKNAQRSGRPVEVDEIHIKAIINSIRYGATRKITEKLNRIHTVSKYLKLMISDDRTLRKRGLIHLLFVEKPEAPKTERHFGMWLLQYSYCKSVGVQMQQPTRGWT